MPIGKYLERRSVQIVAIVGFLVAILMMRQYGAFIAYGIPGVTFHEVTQTNPTSKSVTILGSYGEWVSYEYSGEAEGKWESLVGHRYVKVVLTATLKIKVETSDLALSGFLTEIKPPPFLMNETLTELVYKNMTVQTYAYGFKLTTSWSGSAQITVPIEDEAGLIPWTVPSIQDMVKKCIQTKLIPDFNNNYLTAAKILMSIDGPTLASDKAHELRPDYLGIAGMWLSDYKMVGYTTGTAAEVIPKSTGTAVKLYRDKALTSPCWASDYDNNMGKPLLTPDIVYWLDHFAAPSAWWSISIVNLGSQLVYDDSRPYPNLLCWAWEKWSDTAPAVAQWFRVDIAFRTTKDWTVPKIPEYELPPEEKEKMKVIIKTEPENQGTPLDQPPTAPAFPWREIMYIMLIFFGGLIIAIIVYYVLKRKVEIKRT
jgi:hypothetical protein